MINKGIINAIFKASDNKSKDAVLQELLNHISLDYDYNDSRAGHILEMLVDKNAVVTPIDIDIEYINNNLNLLKYKHEDYNIRNVKVKNIDNIEGNVIIYYEYLEKINEDRDDVSWRNCDAYISFLNNPKLLKKS